MPLLPQLAEYELLKELGGGPLTRVFHARHREGDFRCAVKILRDEWAHDPMARQLLRREARVGLAVRHPQLVKLLDAQVTRDPYYIVMELLAGETLREHLSKNYTLDQRGAFLMARQIAEALAALHRAGFVHGDVKPDNIRLSGAGHAVLIDLGFAHRPGEHEALVRDGYLLGTAEYLAPELCGFSVDHAFASDWFSFGLVMFEALCGELPYPAGTVAEVLRSHVETELAPILRRRSFAWPRPMAQLIERLLSRRPSDRPQGSQVVQSLVALEIAALSVRRSA